MQIRQMIFSKINTQTAIFLRVAEEPSMESFHVYSNWKSRIESAEEIARRLVRLLAQLRPIAVPFVRWYYVITESNIPLLDGNEKWLTGAVASRINTDELGAPVPNGGYKLVAMNALPADAPRDDQVALHISAGGKFRNSADLHPLRGQTLDATIVNYQVFRQIVLAISNAFEPNWCRAAPSSLFRNFTTSDYKEGPVIATCWMIHLAPQLAKQITPPSDLVSERFADGSLFMSATDETFDPQNPRHLEAAQRLFAVLDTLQEKKPPALWRR